MKKIEINRELFAEQAEKLKDDISDRFEDPMNKLMFKESVELFMNDLIKQLFVEKDDSEEEPDHYVEEEPDHYVAVIDYKGKSYYVSTVELPNHDYETVIFKCKRKIKSLDQLDDNNINWKELYFENHKTDDEAYKRHCEIVDNIEDYIERKEKK